MIIHAGSVHLKSQDFWDWEREDKRPKEKDKKRKRIGQDFRIEVGRSEKMINLALEALLCIKSDSQSITVPALQPRGQPLTYVDLIQL